MKTFLGRKKTKKPLNISVLLGSFKDVKCYLQRGSLGSFFRIKPLEMSPLLLPIRSSELTFSASPFPVQDMLMFLWQT